MSVVDLEVTWETPDGTAITESNNHPTAGIGVKYSPGAVLMGGGWNDVVQVRVATDPPVEGVTVYLKAFDPDDPSANATNNVVDGDRDGGDNRDTAHSDTGELSATQVDTDAVGEAVIQFRVAHFAGDNHRIAATLKEPALAALDDNIVTPPGGQG